MSIDPKIVELTADVLEIFVKKLISHKRAPYGCRHSPALMLRVGQGSTST